MEWGFYPKHASEADLMTLIKVTSDLYHVRVNCQFSLFVPIDLSLAADMVNSLLEKVSSLGFRGMVSLVSPTFWAPSLSLVAGSSPVLSSTRSLKVRVLQGSVFGPILFFIYILFRPDLTWSFSFR